MFIAAICDAQQVNNPSSTFSDSLSPRNVDRMFAGVTEAMDSATLILSPDGDIVYITENSQSLLGICQVRLYSPQPIVKL